MRKTASSNCNSRASSRLYSNRIGSKAVLAGWDCCGRREQNVLAESDVGCGDRILARRINDDESQRHRFVPVPYGSGNGNKSYRHENEAEQACQHPSIIVPGSPENRPGEGAARENEAYSVDAKPRESAATIDNTIMASSKLDKLNCQGRFMPVPE